MATIPKISDLRSFVQLVASVQTQQGTGVLVTLTPIATVRGDLKASRPHLFIGAEQLDIDVSKRTHRLIIRWIDSVDIFDTVIRDTYRLDGTMRRETFRVCGVNDMDNQRRFLWIDLQLRTSVSYPYTFTVAETGSAADTASAGSINHTYSETLAENYTVIDALYDGGL